MTFSDPIARCEVCACTWAKFIINMHMFDELGYGTSIERMIM